MTEYYFGWSIKLHENYSKDKLAGVLFFGGMPEPRHDAVRKAIFRTRKQAREAQKKMYCKTSIVRVLVTIEIVDSISK